ncbi:MULTISPECIES: sce7726 family protein [Alteromonas]|uniref:sce7726 family protein n=1 Tax=Alteromonas TaxID=226 RepID=UPI00257AF6E4|nr:sce7726 family protein [Alteromonas sp. AO-Serp]
MKSTIELKHISKAFSSSSFGDLVEGNLASLLVLKKALGFDESSSVEIRHLYEKAFEYLNKNYQSEYIYKCMLYKKVVLGKHSPNTAGLLSELKLGSSKVDAFVVNGIATSYEIKSEFDNLDRVRKQLEDYAKYSDKVFVVGPESKADYFKKNIDESFGIKVLTKRGQFSIVRDSKLFEPIYSPAKVLSLLNSNELKDVAREYGTAIDEVPNTQLFRVCEELLSNISRYELKSIALSALKKRGIDNNKLLVRLPFELSGRAVRHKLSKRKQMKVIEALATQI